MNGAKFRFHNEFSSEPPLARGSSSESLEMLMTSSSGMGRFAGQGDDGIERGTLTLTERDVDGVGKADDGGRGAGEEVRNMLNGEGERDESESKKRGSDRM